MTLFHILVFSGFAAITGLFLPPRWRPALLLAASVLAVYWMQPGLPVRGLDFWLPTASLMLTVLVWAVTQAHPLRAVEPPRRTLQAALLVAGVVLLVGLTRYIDPLCCLTPNRPPELTRVIFALGIGAVLASLPALRVPVVRYLPAALTVLLIALFVILKYEPLAGLSSAGLRNLTGQDTALASPLDLAWLGYSYLAFRLIHALRDYQSGRLPQFGLGEFTTYALFFPAYTAGPIDRSQRFVTDLRQTASAISRAERIENLAQGAWRILWGVFKKFALADSLALIALNPQNAAQVTTGIWAWALLYAYALRIYLDFSGYTDIAIGIARLVGIRLPENFNKPYLRTNLTNFWNSWHITLTQWFRAYVFNPLTRLLKTRPDPLPNWAIILLSQMSLMLLIGLWHGITWNFVLWGLWHGAGLFVHNRWSDWIRPRLPDLSARPALSRALSFSGWLLTFHFVALGWVWFALPAPGLALDTFGHLLGF